MYTLKEKLEAVKRRKSRYGIKRIDNVH